MLLRALQIVAFNSAILFASCGSSGEIRPVSAHASVGQGRKVQLLQDEVQHHTGFAVTAPAGVYTATVEDDDWVYYRGGRVSMKYGLGSEDLAGGLALSKRHVGQAFIYETNIKGERSVMNRRVRAQMIVKP